MWDKLAGTLWKEEINVEDFIQNNYKEYTGNEGFLAQPTKKTLRLQKKVESLKKRELKYYIKINMNLLLMK